MNPIPSHLYVHVPFCDGKCDYCAFFSVPYSESGADAYLDALEAELAMAVRDRPSQRLTETVYIGGGTPSVLDPYRWARLLQTIRRHVSVGAGTEWSSEANPGTVTAAWLEAAVEAGVNRISLGVQAFDDRVLAEIGRCHSARNAVESVALVRNAGLQNLGIDLIAGLPGVKEREWLDTLARTVDLDPEHVSVYALSIEEGSRFDMRARTGRIRVPGEDRQLAALETGEAILTAQGFKRYEISNYARPGFACRHNMACWRGGDYLGVGPSAASRIGRRRYTNEADLRAYVGALNHGDSPPRESASLSPEDDFAERFAFRLRLAEGLDLDDVHRAGGPTAAWTAILGHFEEEGLVRSHITRRCLTARGRNLCDHVIRELLPPCT